MNFVCVLWGNKYSHEYVQKLYNMVQRNTTLHHRFICFTDHVKLPKLVEGDIEVRPLPFHDYQTWWNKLQLFSPEANLVGQTLYMDLDVVILENIDDMFTHGEPDTFSIINNFNLSTKIFNSSIMKFNNKTATNIIWNPWLQNRKELQRMPGDQDVISKLASNNPKFRIFPDEWTFSTKWFSRQKPRFHKTEWTFERGTGKVAVFHGKPDPHECDQEWVKNHWK